MPGPFFWFVVVIGLATLWAAAAFARRPTEHSLAVLRPMCAATIFSALAAFLMGMANGLMAFARMLDRAPDAPVSAESWRLLLRGLAESPAPLVVGFAVVAVAWLLAAVGLRRQA